MRYIESITILQNFETLSISIPSRVIDNAFTGEFASSEDEYFDLVYRKLTKSDMYLLITELIRNNIPICNAGGWVDKCNLMTNANVINIE